VIDIYLDLETIPCQSPEYRARVREGIKPPAQYKKPESIVEWYANNADAATDEIVAKTSFEPAYGHICCIGWAVGDDPARSVSVENIEHEADFLNDFFDIAHSAAGVHMVRWIGHYISGFDLRFLLNRAIVLGVKLPSALILPRDIKPWSDNVFDTMTAWAGPKDRISQDNLAQALGLAGKGDFDGSMVAEAWANGEHAKIADYCRSDVETVRAIYRKFQAVGY
jgi:predicted PolB exonuclease-like 3'-5' exonuclease